MKAILKFIGTGILFCLLLAVIFVGFAYFQIWSGQKRSLEYVNAHIAPFVETFDTGILKQHAAPEFAQQAGDWSAADEAVAEFRNTLGKCRFATPDPEGKTDVGFGQFAMGITSQYTIPLKCTNGTAEISVLLVENAKTWQIVNFSLHSDVRNEDDTKSLNYINEYVVPVIKVWDEEKIKALASPEMLMSTGNWEGASGVFTKFSELGTNKSVGVPKGESRIIPQGSSKLITAQYVIDAEYENGLTAITVGLIKHGEQWQILSIHVISKEK